MPEPARNQPCPCGSKRRYKHCHGRIKPAPGLTGTSTGSPRSSYRASGSDWVDLTEVERDECGVLMERALAHQMAERFEEAATDYAAVLAKAANTHDALHMLGTIELRRGDLIEARRRIVAAMKLRPSYPAIEHNLRLIHDAEHPAAQSPPLSQSPIELCERALPILVDLVLRPRAFLGRGKRSTPPTKTVHVVRCSPATDNAPGWVVTRLAELLDFADLQVWAADGAGNGVASGGSVRRVDEGLADYPRGGCQIFVGVEFNVGPWVREANAERAIVFCPPAPPAQLLDQLRALSDHGARPLSLVFPSRAMAERFGSGHPVLPPPVEVRRDAPALDRDRESARARLAGLRVGAMGSNWRGQRVTEQAQFLKDVAASAGTLSLYDATLFRYSLGGNSSVRFHARAENGLESFLDSLDCLLLYPEPWWREGDGREFFTAMTSGVPVLCPAASIYAEYIADGVDGLLYRSRDEAIRQLVDLRRSPTRVALLGAAARAKVAKLLDAAALARTLRQLVTGQPVGPNQRGESVRLKAVAS
jgi:hypothetical protein